MKDTLFKAVVRRLFFRTGAIRTIRSGPMRGMVFRVSSVTGLSPWYSGPEREHQRAFKTLIRPGDIVLDIGANWGLHTLYFSQLVGRDGMVISIEPFPPAFAELQWHIGANARRNVRTLSVAMSDSDQKALFVPGSSASTGSLASVSSIPSAQADPISVMTRTLDSVVEELGIKRPKLVKIDVEGVESQVLLGAKRTIERYHPYFVIDLHTPEQDVLVAHLLTSQGYKLSRLSGPLILRTDIGWPEPTGVWGSIVAAPTL